MRGSSGAFDASMSTTTGKRAPDDAIDVVVGAESEEQEPRSACYTASGSPASSIEHSITESKVEVAPPARKKPRLSREQRVARIAGAVSTILECLDDTPERDGLRKTPQRYAKALLELTSGYAQSAHAVLGDAHFDECHSELVLVRDIAVFSLCEHHLLPFHGTCHIAYMPSGNSVVGLSKLARIVEVYARRLQVQERLTNQIADAVHAAANAQGVMVYMSCKHLCMSMRGVHKPGAVTVTSAARGRYTSDSALRQEFLTTIR